MTLIAADNFQITLSSKSSLDIYPENNAANFTVQLKKELILNGEWEVAAVDISFHKNIYNFKETVTLCVESLCDTELDEEWEEENFIYADEHYDKTFVKTIKTKYLEYDADLRKRYFYRFVTVPRSYYDGVQGLVNYINREFKKLHSYSQIDPKFELFFDEHEDKLYTLYDVTKVTCTMLVSNATYFRKIIGLSPSCTNNICQLYPRLEEVNMVYVYCNIIHHQLVGDTEVQKIGQVPIDKHIRRASHINWQFVPPYYCPLSTNTIKSIEVQLSSQTGELIDFFDTRVYLRLHFRRKQFAI